MPNNKRINYILVFLCTVAILMIIGILLLDSHTDLDIF